MQKKLGLKLPFIHLEYELVSDLWRNCPNREIAIQKKIDSIKLCASEGVNNVVIHPSDYREPETDFDWQIGLESFQKLAEVASINEVKISLENLTGNVPLLEFLLDNIKSQWVGLCYDCGHHYYHSPKINFLEKYEGRVFAVHLQDNCLEHDMHLLPGDGKIDFSLVIKQLETSLYSGTLMLEAHRYGPTQKRCDDKRYAGMPLMEFLNRAKICGEQLLVWGG
ncbi:MAG: sugar phosphate isomerase/epimerase [Pseudomonadales bacterium]|jgi:sugar phosphate isomerase/epimerase|nr:sugar phosphate isomerase/epimerase [Pseudomonadales bacterium]